MSNVIEHNGKLIFHPGYFVEECMEYSGLNQREFALKLGTTPKTLSKIINGEQGISADLADKLNKVTGSEGEFWLNLQSKYNYAVLNLKDESVTKVTSKIVNDIYKYLDGCNFVSIDRESTKKIDFVCSYLQISDLDVLLNESLLTCFRQTKLANSEENIIKSNALIYIAQRLAEKEDSKKFKYSALKNSLEKIAELSANACMSYKDLKKAFSELGIIFICLPYMKGSGLNGFVKKYKDSVLLGVTDKGKTNDIFWFTLFHEIAHILKSDYVASFDDDNESEVDYIAADILLPNDKYSDFVDNSDYSLRAVKEFSNVIKRAPAIVAGRLCHDKHLSYNSKTARQTRKKLNLFKQGFII